MTVFAYLCLRLDLTVLPSPRIVGIDIYSADPSALTLDVLKERYAELLRWPGETYAEAATSLLDHLTKTPYWNWVLPWLGGTRPVGRDEIRTIVKADQDLRDLIVSHYHARGKRNLVQAVKRLREGLQDQCLSGGLVDCKAVVDELLGR